MLLAVMCFKPGLHEPQLPVESSVTLVFSIVVERRLLRSFNQYCNHLKKRLSTIIRSYCVIV